MSRDAGLEAADRGRLLGVRIHRLEPPQRWRQAVDAIADPAERAAAEAYLRDIADRTRAAGEARRRLAGGG